MPEDDFYVKQVVRCIDPPYEKEQVPCHGICKILHIRIFRGQRLLTVMFPDGKTCEKNHFLFAQIITPEEGELHHPLFVEVDD